MSPIKRKIVKCIGIFACVVLVGFGIFCITPTGRAAINNYHNAIAEVDEATLYANKKEVEDTCRSMIVQYKNEVLGYNNSMTDYDAATDDVAKRMALETAHARRDRANTIATKYNEYVLKNSHVWKENVPDDIYLKLEYVE